jgi:hypothetical protein
VAVGCAPAQDRRRGRLRRHHDGPDRRAAFRGRNPVSATAATAARIPTPCRGARQRHRFRRK